MRVAVAMCTYNGAAYIGEQLASLMAQTRPPDAIVISDDGSSDGTQPLIENFIRQNGLDGRVMLYSNAQRLGYRLNFYRTARMCSADIVFFCDQDDIWDARKIEVMTGHMERDARIPLMACAHRLIDSDGAPLSSGRYRRFRGSGGMERVRADAIVRDFCWPGMCMAARKDFLDAVCPALERVKTPHDRALALASEACEGFYFLDAVLAAHRRHGNNAGGEEHRFAVYMTRENKRRELKDAIDWLDMPDALLSDAGRRASAAYRAVLRLRLDGLERRSPGPLIRAIARYGRYVRPQAIAADLWLMAADRRG